MRTVQGRVTESSVKNFQLCCDDVDLGFSDNVLLQFGRVEKHKFNMDVQFPLSPFQVLWIPVTQFGIHLIPPVTCVCLGVLHLCGFNGRQAG